MNKNISMYTPGQVQFCTQRFCFIADGENGKMLAFAANVLLLTMAAMTAARAISIAAKGLN